MVNTILKLISLINWCRIRNCVISDQLKIACHCSFDNGWSAYQTFCGLGIGLTPTFHASSFCICSRCDLINNIASIAHDYDFMNILKARFSTRLANGYLFIHTYQVWSNGIIVTKLSLGTCLCICICYHQFLHFSICKMQTVVCWKLFQFAKTLTVAFVWKPATKCSAL